MRGLTRVYSHVPECFVAGAVGIVFIMRRHCLFTQVDCGNKERKVILLPIKEANSLRLLGQHHLSQEKN